MTEQTKIAIKNLNFYYHKNEVIKAFNLEVRANEILAVFGPANSGTTTLLRTLNRMWDLIPERRWKVRYCSTARIYIHRAPVLLNYAGR